MGKKRKASRAAAPSGPRGVDPSDARLGPIRSYKDVADEQDEFLMGQDRIMFDDSQDDDEEGDGPRAKRQRQQEEEDLELSDEEVLGYDDPDDEYEYIPQKGKKAKSKRKKGDDDDEDDGDDDDMDNGQGADQGWWGASRGEYYDADNIETEADALEEEAEAKRLQKKQLAKMAEEDFMFDEAEWAASGPAGNPGAGAAAADATVTEVLEHVEIPADMTPEERYKLLQAQYPEFDHLVQEFNSVQPLIDGLRSDAAGKPGTTVEAVKYWVLGCYVAALGSYFAILTSPARDAKGQATTKALSPADLRDHEIMDTLVRCRQAWLKVKDLRGKNAKSVAIKSETPTDALYVGTGKEEEKMKKKKKNKSTEVISKSTEKAKTKTAKAGEEEGEEEEEAETAVADLYNLSHRPSGSTKVSTNDARRQHSVPDDMSDFGEEEALDAHTAAQKATRKKSLRFYTSQIVQKANKRAGAGRDAGGDTDIPHRQSLREREEKNRQAKAKARASAGAGAGAGTNNDGGEWAGGNGVMESSTNTGTQEADSDAEYYDMVASAARRKKADKKAYNEAAALAGALDRVVEVEEVGDDGKRKVSYAIEKNKGLAPKRKKEVRNPRVKYRNKMAKTMKKLVSRRGALHKEEGRHGYEGERTGINMRVIKSVKL